jgi:Tetratricopeptide repeat
MSLQSERHLAVLGELTEWWEDLGQRGLGSHVVLVPVPPGWGRSTVLGEFRAVVEEGPVTLVVPVNGNLEPGRAVQAEGLRKNLTDAGLGSRAAARLGLGTPAGKAVLGLGVGGLFVSGLAVAASVLLASLAVTAAGNAWDGSQAGEEGAVARAARAVAAVSVSVPVVVIIDDADCLDPGLAVTLIRNLAGRQDGQVLVVAAAGPGSGLRAALSADAGYELAGRVDRAEADPDMGYRSRAELAGELRPQLPAAGIERIAQRTRTFAEVFAVAAGDRLDELSPDTDAAAALAVVDAVAAASLDRARPSAEATVLAWAGGALHAGQADRALAVLDAQRHDPDRDVARSGSLARLAGPVSPRLTEQVAALPAAVRRKLAAAVLGEAIRLAADPGAGLVERVVARQAAHRMRADLEDRSELTKVQCALIRGLEKLGDPAAACQVATTALAELPAGVQSTGERQELLMAALRLAPDWPRHGDDPLVEEAVALALAGGATVSLEARVWAAVDLLARPGRREAALQLTDQVTAELETSRVAGPAADQWRLLLAFHAGRAGYPATAQRLLSRMIRTGSASQQEAAQAVLYAVGGPRADTRLQIVILEAELSETPAAADDDRLRLHATLAADYATLGEYQQALRHGNQELALRRGIQGPDHPRTLITRGIIAFWTGQCGDFAEALRLFEELLPDRVRVLGAGHPDTLATRDDIAGWTGECGDAAAALRLFEELLPDQVRVLGAGHPDTLVTRGDIAAWTGECGDAAGALRQAEELLPDQVRVLGAGHPDTLATRDDIAYWTGKCGEQPPS